MGIIAVYCNKWEIANPIDFIVNQGEGGYNSGVL